MFLRRSGSRWDWRPPVRHLASSLKALPSGWPGQPRSRRPLVTLPESSLGRRVPNRCRVWAREQRSPQLKCSQLLTALDRRAGKSARRLWHTLRRERCVSDDRPSRPRRRHDGVREEHARTCARGEDWFAGDSPRRPLLEAGLGAAVGRRVARTATRAAHWRCLDHRRQLQRDARPSARTRGYRRLSSYSLVVVREPRICAGASQARWRDARGLQGLGQPTPARRVGWRLEDMAQPPFRTCVRTLRDLAARVSHDGVRAPFAAGGEGVSRCPGAHLTAQPAEPEPLHPTAGCGYGANRSTWAIELGKHSCATRGQSLRSDKSMLTVVQLRAVPAGIGVRCRPPRLSSARRMLRANPSGVHRYSVRPTTRASSRLALM